MNGATVERLNRLNREFYSEHAGEWDQVRDRHWQGWERVADEIRPVASRGRLSVLDVGCGNGRFASYLHERLGGFAYVGLDSSPELLQLALSRIEPLDGVDGQLHESDLTREALSEKIGDWRFDLVGAFGLLHHVPSLSLRGELLIDLVRLLAPNGLLAVNFWQFAEYDRFRRRFVDWESFNRANSDPVDLGQLEDGDYLLAWGDEPRAVRYCHWSSPAEVRALISSAGTESFELYSGREGDRFNLYALIRSSPCA